MFKLDFGSDAYECCGASCWRWCWAVIRGRPAPHRWVALDAAVGTTMLSGNQTFTLELACAGCGLKDRITHTRLPAILEMKIQLTPAARRALGLHVQPVIEFRNSSNFAVDATGAALASAAPASAFPPLVRRPSRIAAAARWVGRGLGATAKATWRVASAPVRWPLNAVRAWGRWVAVNPLDRCIGPALLATLFGSLLALLLYMVVFIPAPHDPCQQRKFTGVVADVRVTRTGYLGYSSVPPVLEREVTWLGGPAYLVTPLAGEAIPIPGVSGYICERGHFHYAPEPSVPTLPAPAPAGGPSGTVRPGEDSSSPPAPKPDPKEEDF